MEDRPGSVARADAVAGRRVLLAQLLPAIAVLTGVLLAQSRPGLEIRSFDTPTAADAPQAAADLRAAWSAQDQTTVAQVLARPGLDRFALVDELLALGAVELATRAAQDATSAAHAALPEFVRGWQTLDAAQRGQEAAQRAVLARARALDQAQQWQSLLDALAPALAQPPLAWSLVGPQLLALRATAERGLGRDPEAAASFRAAARAAAALGWLAFAASQHVDAGNAASRHGDHAAGILDYQAALALRTRMGDRGTAAQLWRSLGALHSQDQDLPAAITSAERACAEYRALGDLAAVADVLVDLGTYASAQGAPEQAIARYQEARTTAQAASRPARAATSLGCIGTVLFQTGRPRQAIAQFAQAAQELEPLDARGDRMLMLFWLGRSQLAVAELDAADQSLGQALQLAESAADDRGIRECLGQLGAVATRRGNYPRALELHARARDRAAATGDRNAAAGHRSSMGLLQVQLGEFAGAVHNLEQALTEQETLGDVDGAMATREALSGAYSTLGDHTRALALQDAVVAHEERGHDARGLAIALANRASILKDLGRLDEALAGDQRALALCERAGDRSGSAVVLANMGWCHARAGRLPEAIDHFARALEQCEALGNRAAAATQRGNLAAALSAAGRPREALPHLEQALAELADTGQQDVLASAFGTLAQARQALGDHSEAIAAGLRYQELKLRMSRGLGDVAGRRSQSQVPRAAEAVLCSIHALLASRPPAAAVLLDQAFTAMENTRATLLAESLANRSALGAARIPAPERAEQARARAAALAARQTLARAAAQRQDPATLQALRQTLDTAYAGFEAATARVQQAALRAADAVAPGPVTLTAAQRALPPHTALVLYQLTRTRTFALTVTATTVHLDDLGPTAELEAAAAAWLRIVPQAQSDDAPAAARLYDLLVRPLEARLASQERLLVAPDGALAFVPFEALVRSESTTMPRLLERWEVGYVPSATVFTTLVAQPATATGTRLLAVGDPIYPEAAASQPGSPLATRLPRLSGSGEEVQALATLVGAEHTTQLQRAAATRTGLLTALAAPGPRLRAVHLGCHAHVDGQRPRLTGLLLGGGELLSLDDIAQLELRTDLVVLAACESGRGSLQAGEGVMGLTRAWFCAGAPRVVVADWRIDDQATRALMVEFYRGLVERSLAPGAALRAAKRAALRAGGAAAHPAHWAAFVLWGLP